MNRKYKKSYLVINIILSIISLFLLINVFFIKNTNFWFASITTFLTFLIIFLIYGYEKKNRRFTYESMFSVFSYCSVYLIITYIIGIFTGFNRNIYQLNFSNLIKNIIPYIAILVSGELLRYEISRKGETSVLANALVTIILITIDCTIYLNSFNLNTGDGLTKYICYIILPSISKNGFLLYLTRTGGVYPCIMYRTIIDLKIFIIPIFPDFGLYLESILNLLFPPILGFLSCKIYDQYRNKEIDGKALKHSSFYFHLGVVMMISMIIVLVALNSNKFKYSVISIGSGSMTGVIDKGDAVIYENMPKNNNIKVGKILVFRKENRIIVHRIIEKVKVGKDEYVYYTKGDANNTPDGYPILEEEVIGVVKARLRFLGKPSVYINELLH